MFLANINFKQVLIYVSWYHFVGKALRIDKVRRRRCPRRVGEALRGELAHASPCRHPEHSEGWRVHTVCRRKCPRHVGKALRGEFAHAPPCRHPEYSEG